VRDLLNRVLVALLILLLPLPGLGADPEVLRLAFYLPGFRDANPADVRISLQIWADEVGSGYGLRARAMMYDDLKTLHQDAHDAKVDVVIASGMELAETFHPNDFVGGFTGLRNNTPEGLVLITSQQGGIQHFADLRGKRLARLSNDRLSDVYLSVLCAREAKAPCEQLFQTSEEKRDVQSIHKVFFGKADAALVRISTLRAAQELNPQISQRIKALQEWKTAALSFGLLLPHTSPAFQERIIQVALTATKSVRGRQILELFKTDYMERVDKSALQPFWQLYREYQALSRTVPARK
jgi:ABC-type phosphate/phosphonate transport system substrate-binding protein